MWAWMKGQDLILTDEKGGWAKVTIADVYQSNGVIYVIDTVLMPQVDRSSRAASSARGGRQRRGSLAIKRRTSTDGVAEKLSNIPFPHLTENAACFDRQVPQAVRWLL